MTHIKNNLNISQQKNLEFILMMEKYINVRQIM